MDGPLEPQKILGPLDDVRRALSGTAVLLQFLQGDVVGHVQTGRADVVFVLLELRDLRGTDMSRRWRGELDGALGLHQTPRPHLDVFKI